MSILDKEKPYILCVDDDPMNLELLEEFLENDYATRCVSDGQQCIDSVAQHRPDLILLDFMMPMMDGKQTCKILKASEVTKTIPIIILSGRSFPEDVEEIYAMGADSYLSKPFSGQQLLALVSDVFHD